MRVTFWGTRGSLARSGPSTVRYGGDTAAVEVQADDGSTLFLDAGSGISRAKPPTNGRVDVLLTHLHMDHIQGLGFCKPLFDPALESHIWGPSSTTMALDERLGRYLSPPLFPVRLRDLPRAKVHDLAPTTIEIGPFRIVVDLICHPGPTLGYRIEDEAGGSIAYLPDHEPALGTRRFPIAPAWTSGHALAEGVDVLIHDAQYTDAEYQERVGWGHSAFAQTVAFAQQAGVKTLVPFHHDPDHSDDFLDHMFEEAIVGPLQMVAGRQDITIEV
ncbi:MAG TPA: MBL fold metallo-hydrolase [Acidimicrobiia bacterium]